MIKNENIGEEKIMKTRLTKSEFAVMEVLWDEGEELTSAEIIQKSKEREWKDSSIHLIINSLLRKKVVTVAGFKKTTKNYARTFVPVETREQFLVGQIIDDKTTTEDKKGIYSYIIGKESDPELINYIEKLLEERKKELRIKSNERTEFRHMTKKQENNIYLLFLCRLEWKEKENDTWRKNKKVQGIAGADSKSIGGKSRIFYWNTRFPYKKI